MMMVRARTLAGFGFVVFVAVAGMRMIAIVAMLTLIAADIFTQPHEFLLRHRALRLNVPLQRLPFVNLLEYQRVFLRAVAAFRRGEEPDERCPFCDGKIAVISASDRPPHTIIFVDCPCRRTSGVLKGL